MNMYLCMQYKHVSLYANFPLLYQEVELLRTELEVTHRHLEGKHEALRILQGQVFKHF